MARFRGTVEGNRGEASRLGTKGSGLVSATNGWDVGVKVDASVEKDDTDKMYVYATGGSNSRTWATGVMQISREGDEIRIDLENCPEVVRAARALLDRITD